jgi:transcriptional regulator with GAF, ATPase, and Fis domain
VSAPSGHERRLGWLRRVRDLSHALATELDVRALLPRIVDAAVEVGAAERGFLVRLSPGGEGPPIRVEAARGFDGEQLAGPAGKVSRTVIQRVLQEQRAVLTSSEDDEDLVEVSSVRRRRVRSIVAVPVSLRGEIRGALYLDHRFEHEAFSADDLPLLELFASQAALALETAELHGDRRRLDRDLTRTLDEIEALRETRAAVTRAERPLPTAGEVPRFGGLVGDSPPMQALYTDLERAARAQAPVLIVGESGAGKEQAALELHRRGARPDAPWLAFNCAALSDALLESELFGHVQGAFTDARAARAGLFVEAGSGTLLLDEVGETSLGVQAKLLRVLQERRVRPVGGERWVPVKCRLLAATHRDLQARVREGLFREDLYYRLDVLRLHVPPLRDRLDDVPALMAALLARAGSPALDVDPEALALLATYGWPGNVRELHNEVRRLAALGVPRIEPRHLSAEVRADPAALTSDSLVGRTLGEMERGMLVEALHETGGNKSRAARRLGVARSTLYALLARHGLG